MSTLLTYMVTARPYKEKVRGCVQADGEDLLTARTRSERAAYKPERKARGRTSEASSSATAERSELTNTRRGTQEAEGAGLLIL